MTSPSSSFDPKRLATPADWAALDDFNEEEIIKAMSARVDETFAEAKEELAREKAANLAKKQNASDAAQSAAALNK